MLEQFRRRSVSCWAISRGGGGLRKSRRDDRRWRPGASDEAVADFSQALRLKPEDHWSLSQRGKIYVRREQFELGLADLTAVLELSPDSREVDLWLKRAVAHRGLGNFEAALADLARVIELDPDNSKPKWTGRQNAHRLRGEIYANDLQQTELADNEYSIALELDPDNKTFQEDREQARLDAPSAVQTTSNP